MPKRNKGSSKRSISTFRIALIGNVFVNHGTLQYFKLHQYTCIVNETFLQDEILNYFCSTDEKHKLPIFALDVFRPHPKFNIEPICRTF